jgi:uncharacterized lipoprotein YddW (UPF0748 family)
MSALAFSALRFGRRAFFRLAAAACVVGATAPLHAQAPSKEFRGAWVATVYNIDWPAKPGLPAATQKAQLIAILDRAKELKLNAILLQVRPASDALYSSKARAVVAIPQRQAGRFARLRSAGVCGGGGACARH